MQKNKVKISFPSLSCNEAFARSAAAAFVAPMDPTMEEMEDIRTAVSEAVTNAIVHAYPDGCGEIVMTIGMLDEKTVEITVSDRGVGIPDIEAAMEPMFTTGGAERSGMGFTIMEKFMSRLKVHSVPGEGTKVVMLRTLGEGQS